MPWQLRTARQHFSELVERAKTEGPQVVAKHRKDAVVFSVEEYRQLTSGEPSRVEFIRSAPDLDLLDLDRAVDRGRDSLFDLPARDGCDLRDSAWARPERRRLGKRGRRPRATPERAYTR
jgi:antitoxin Phd